MRIAVATRTDSRIRLGASPRAVVQLARCAKAKAYLEGRTYVTPDDVKELSVESLSHRVRLKQSTQLRDETVEVASVIRDVVDGVQPPR
jgi:MoxR-like ATPase